MIELLIAALVGGAVGTGVYALSLWLPEPTDGADNLSTPRSD